MVRRSRVLRSLLALAATSLQGLLAYLVVVSAGTLLAAIALGTPEAQGAALFYLLHSTWVAGALFLLADLVSRQRGDKGGHLVQGPALQNPAVLGAAFFFGAIAVAGLPPLSGFFAKLLLLQAVPPGAGALPLWSVLLIGGFFRSLQITSLNGMVYAEIEQPQMSRASTISSMGQQLTQSVGVGLAALMLHWVMRFQGDTRLDAGTVPPVFFAVGLLSFISLAYFLRLHPTAGDDMNGRIRGG